MSERLTEWLNDVQLSNRLGTPHYANPSELKADLRDLLADLAAAVRAADELRETLEIAADLLAGEGYDTDPDYKQEWQTISDALASLPSATNEEGTR